MANTQVTSLLDNRVLRRLERLRFNSSRRFTNRSQGEHLAGRFGQSTEFFDYRDYAAGDDIRHVDWNIFSRLHRPYLKLYRQEEEMHVLIIIDNSLSMDFENKLAQARQLAAAFGVVGLLNGERVSVYTTNPVEALPSRLDPCRGRSSMNKLFPFAESIAAAGSTTLDDGVEEVLKRHRGRGVAVLLSDFMTFGDLARSFNLLFRRGLEIAAIQILSPTELYPELTGDVRFVDCEFGETLDVSSVGELIEIYHQYRQSFEDRLRGLCTKRNGRFASLNAETDIESVLFDDLLRRGWLR